MTKQVHLAAHFPGVNNTTVWSDPKSGSHIEFSSFEHLAQTAERAKFDFLFLAEGLRLREQNGQIYDLDVVGRPDTFTVLAALAAVTDRLGLAGTINSTFNEPYEVARQFASLDHLSGGRAAWNVVTSWDAFTGENFRRGGFLPQEARYERARTFMETTWELFDSWHGDEIIADKESGLFLAGADAGRFAHRDAHFDIAGRFNVPRSPQGRPVIFQAGDSDEGREFAASSADAIFSRHGTLAEGVPFYADVKGRLAKYGRAPDQLLILPAATFVLGDTDADAVELARVVRRQQVSGQTAIAFLEQLWNRDLSGYDPDGPLPDVDPDLGEHTDRPRPRERPDAPGPDSDRRPVAGQGGGGEAVHPRPDHRGHRPPDVHRLPGHGRRRHQRPGAGGRQRRVHPGAAHHPGRARRVRRHGRAAAAGARCLPDRVRGQHAPRAPGPGSPRQHRHRPGGVVKFLAITLIVHAPDLITGVQKSTTDRFREVIGNALLAEELGFDGFGVGERHERPFISSSPPVVLSHIAALTSRIRLFTAVTTLSLLDPVRAYEDYATLDHLSGGRLELIIGKGNGAAQRELFSVTPEDQWDRNAESYELFRQIWRNPTITATPRFRPPLREAEVWPRPLQQPIRVWHGSATSRESVDLAARYGDPLFSANVTNPIEPYAALVRYYRERWAHYGHEPASAVVGAGTAGYYATRNSQDALRAYRPIFDAQRAFQSKLGLPPVFTDLDDFVARSSALIGSPQQVIDKVRRYHQQFGHSVLHLHADAGGLTDAQHRESLELFQSDIAPVLRREIPDPPWTSPAPDSLLTGSPA